MSTQIKWNNNAFYELRRSPEVIAMLEEKAKVVAAKANAAIPETDGYPAGTEHYATGSRQGERRPQGRWRTTVVTATEYGKRFNAVHHILLKALNG